MEHIVAAPVALFGSPGQQQDMTDGIQHYLREVNGGYSPTSPFSGNVVSLFHLSAEGDGEADAHLVAVDQLAWAAREAGYEATLGVFVQVPASEGSQRLAQERYQALLDHFDGCECVEDPTHGNLIPSEYAQIAALRGASLSNEDSILC